MRFHDDYLPFGSLYDTSYLEERDYPDDWSEHDDDDYNVEPYYPEDDEEVVETDHITYPRYADYTEGEE